MLHFLSHPLTPLHPIPYSSHPLLLSPYPFHPTPFIRTPYPTGGETNFPDLGIAVRPKKGRGLLWPSTLDSDPSSIDVRTMHEVRGDVRRGCEREEGCEEEDLTFLFLTSLHFTLFNWLYLFSLHSPFLFFLQGKTRHQGQEVRS
jgi:hypothetical protein